MNMAQQLRVALIEDSRLCAAIVRKTVEALPETTYLGCTETAGEALRMVREALPDILIMDLNLPDARGFELLEKIRKDCPARIIVITSSTATAEMALRNGASDFLEKPDGVGERTMPQFCSRLSLKLKMLCSQLRGTPGQPRKAPQDSLRPSPRLVAIGASLGGPAALLRLLQDMPAHAPGMVAALHMPAGFTGNYAERLNRQLAVRVRQAEDGDLVRTGEVLIAPGGRQTRVSQTPEGFRITCSEAEGELYAPSVDLLFHSVAQACGALSAGVLLTGMGADGAQGLKAMREAGAHTVVQDEATSVVWGMPGAAFRLGAAARVLPLEQIAADVIGTLKETRTFSR